jgi:hypothetical protein
MAAHIVEMEETESCDALKFRPQLSDEAVEKLKKSISPFYSYLSWLGFSVGQTGYKGNVDLVKTALGNLLNPDQEFLPAMVISEV